MSHSPEGFNYQAVARDPEGNPLKNKSLKIRIIILQNEEPVWQEEHQVETNITGLFSLIVGSPDVGGSGAAGSFDNIDWDAGTFALKADVDDGTGYTDFSPHPILSVPFAYHAPNRSGWSNEPSGVITNNTVEIVAGERPPEKPLFEVKNDRGNPVFAVYNDSVMVYVDESIKGVKGGFAVGGYSNTTKGVTQEYLKITPDNLRVKTDSVRVFVNDDQMAKGVKGGFAVGGYSNATKGATDNYMEITRASTHVFFDETQAGKGVKGGFAVGGYKSGKGESDQMMSLTPENYLIGQEAGYSLSLDGSTGYDNSFLGYQAGFSTTSGSGNIYLGKSAGFLSKAPRENIFIGNESGYAGTDTRGNVYVGNQTGHNGSTGDYNTFIGYRGGYSNTASYNSFIGFTSGYYNTSGDYNTFFGYRAGYNNTTGANNILIGTQAGYGNPVGGTGMTGSNNIFMGNSSGYNSTSGRDNIFIGNSAGYTNTTGVENVYMGYQAGYSFNGDRNVILGYTAGRASNVSNSVVVGDEAGYNAQSGWGNVIIGQRAGYNNGMSGTSPGRNTFVGRNAGEANDQGSNNTYLGAYSGNNAVNGRFNTFLGDDAGSVGVPGDGNVYAGYRAGYTNNGQSNVVIGREAGSRQSNYTLPADYDYNILIGYRAGYNLNTGSSNIFIGPYAGYNETGSDRLYIDNSTTSSPLIWGDFANDRLRVNGNMGINYSALSGYGLIVDTPSGQTETYALFVVGNAYATVWSGSDARYKKNITAVSSPVEKLEQINGVSFEWDETNKYAPADSKSIGVLAQDVQQVFPELVKEDMEGYLAVNYSGLIPVLIEAIKEQQKQIETLQLKIADLENR